MLVKNIVNTLLYRCVIFKSLKINFTTETPEFVLHPDIKHCAQINVRAARRNFLKNSVLNHNKIVLWAEKRKLTDKVIPLKNEGKCVGVIKRHPSIIKQGEQSEVDVVLQGRMIKGMRRNKTNGLMTVYVRVEDKEYKCILSYINMHHEGWIQSVILEEYVPGEANKLLIPIQITHITQNAYFQQGSEFNFKQQSVDIICYNEEHPLRFYVDSSFVCPERPYRYGDLANTFPPGIILAPEINPNKRIFEIMPIEKMQLHLKQKLMKSYLASTKKQKVIGGGQAQGGTATGATGTGAAGGSTGSAGGQQSAKK